MISQNLSQFSIHARAILGIPVNYIEQFGPSASRAVVLEGNYNNVEFSNIDKVLDRPLTDMRIFGKPEVRGHRRMAVLLARRNSVDEARSVTKEMLNDLVIKAE